MSFEAQRYTFRGRKRHFTTHKTSLFEKEVIFAIFAKRLIAMRTITTLIYICLIGILPCRAINDEEKINHLLEQAYDVQYSNPKQAAYYAQQAFELMPGEGKNDLKAEALLAISTAQNLLGEFDLGIKTLYEGLEYVTPENKTLEGRMYNVMSVLYCRLSDYSKAISIIEKATAIFKSIKDSTDIAVCYNNRGIIHTYLNEFHIAEQFFLQALNINRSLKNLKNIAGNLNNLCLYEGNTEEKLGFIQEAIAINKNLGSNWSLAENYNNMAKQYFYAKEYARALEALKTSHGIAVDIGAKELICDNYEYSSWVYSALGDYKNAYKYLQQLSVLSKELQSSNKLRNIEQEIAQTKYQEQRRAAELKEQEYEIELLRRNQYLLSIIFVSLIIVSVFLYKWYKRKKNLELMEARYSLEQSEREVAELKIRQQELELEHVQSALDNSRQEATSFAVFLQSRNKLLDKIRDMIKQGYKLSGQDIVPHLKKVNAFIKQYQNGDKTNSSVLLNIEEKNQEFLQRLTQKHPNLTQGEKYLVTLLRVNLSTKEISMLTGTMPKTINMNRYRLRKALELSSEEDLAGYLQSI